MPQRTDTNGPAGAPSIISTDVTITGDLDSKGELQLDGRVTGDIRCKALVLGEKGRIKGDISAETVTLRGHVEGTIEARVVRLEKTAKLSGDIFHETLSVEAGAIIDGQITYASKQNTAGRRIAMDSPDSRQNSKDMADKASSSHPPPQAAE